MKSFREVDEGSNQLMKDLKKNAKTEKELKKAEKIISDMLKNAFGVELSDNSQVSAKNIIADLDKLLK